MIKIKSKFFLQIISIVFMWCLLAQVLPSSVLGAAIQEPVIKNGELYADVTEFTDDRYYFDGDKITANGAKYDLKLDGETVGSFFFNKHDPYIKIIITSDVKVSVTWNCSAKYASCALHGVGIYEMPQLLNDKGKAQSFDAIWINNIVTEAAALEAFCRQYAQYKSNGDATECERIYNELTSTEITVTVRPTVLSGTGDIQTNRAANFWVWAAAASPVMYDYPHVNIIGYVLDVGNMIGAPNSKYTKLVTTDWDGNLKNPIAGEALTNANMGYLATGPIEVVGAYTDQPSWDNYLIACYLNSGSTTQWTYLPAQKVNSTLQTYSYGNFTTKFANVSISCTSMYPGLAGTPVQKNSIFFDAVGAY